MANQWTLRKGWGGRIKLWFLAGLAFALVAAVWLNPLQPGRGGGDWFLLALCALGGLAILGYDVRGTRAIRVEDDRIEWDNATGTHALPFRDLGDARLVHDWRQSNYLRLERRDGTTVRLPTLDADIEVAKEIGKFLGARARARN